MAEPTAHSEAPAGHTAFPPFEAEHFPSQLVWLAISFVLLYALMSRIALPRIGAIMAARSKVISDDLAAAEGLKEQSNSAQGPTSRRLPTRAHARRGSPTRPGNNRRATPTPCISGSSRSCMIELLRPNDP